MESKPATSASSARVATALANGSTATSADYMATASASSTGLATAASSGSSANSSARAAMGATLISFFSGAGNRPFLFKTMRTYLPKPKDCDTCHGLNIQFDNFKCMYICKDCNASTGCHKDTDIPLGKMADVETRLLRKRAHLAFDPLWQKRYMARTRAYFWLSSELNINYIDCHIGWLTKDQLKRTIELCTNYIELNRKSLEKRRQKHVAKYRRQFRKTVKRIGRRKSRGH
jgi:hypothetical protein